MTIREMTFSNGWKLESHHIWSQVTGQEPWNGVTVLKNLSLNSFFGRSLSGLHELLLRPRVRGRVCPLDRKGPQHFDPYNTILFERSTKNTCDFKLVEYRTSLRQEGKGEREVVSCVDLF